MKRHALARSSYLSPDIPPIVRLWLLRILISLDAQKEFVGHHGFSNDPLARALGLGDWIDPELREFEPKTVRSIIRKLHETEEKKLSGSMAPIQLSQNIERLANLVGLAQADCRILEFTVLLHSVPMLEDTSEWLGQLSTDRVFGALSIIMGIPLPEVRFALSAQGILARSGLVTVDRRCSGSLRNKLDLLSASFADNILTCDADPVGLLRDTVTTGRPPQLNIGDYGHISATLQILWPYLRKSIADGKKGVNIFIHGKPGTGKTQLAKVLAKELECEMFEVASEDGDGDAVEGEQRLRAYRAAQSFFAQRRAVILFDEVEDVFDDGNAFFGQKSTAQTRKAWMNRILEENPIPTFWLSNSIEGLDPAFIRRFDMVFELPIPPKKQRERILHETCSDLLDAASLARLAESEALVPAVTAKVATVIRSIAAELDQEATPAAFEFLINNTLEAQGHERLVKHDPGRLSDIYDPMFINADEDLAAIADELAKYGAGRICLYGPPGTGKTAYGRWLAEQLGKPILIRRASDLMSKWVGGNEKNIAAAFRQAEEEGALLLIDEVDSFLQDRRGAQRGWEVSMVNEMLTQMESFPGVFIASTNLMDNLDQAALRRFDIKAKFDFLLPKQAAELLCRYCAKQGLEPPEPGTLARVMSLPRLTPGDFATVQRKHRLRPIGSPSILVSSLEKECAIKGDIRPAIGFLQ